MNTILLNKNLLKFRSLSRNNYINSDYYNSFIQLRNFLFVPFFFKFCKERQSLFSSAQVKKLTISEERRNRMCSFAVSYPHHKKKEKGGEDYYYINDNIIVIADGVGGWNTLGVDPREYSKSICQSIRKHFKENEKTIDEKSAKELIIKASEEVSVEGSR